ncbi:MAG: DUF2249 domain-containing protein [Rhodospirillales bacterium]|nr:DUF2249 domain-containing protein [Rhodospirillales bacterium]MBO6788383.1 DUF2249 domain-containing protein [Rhodospirillales bacterium]
MSIAIAADTSWHDVLMSNEDLFDEIVERKGDAIKFQRVLMNERIAQMLTLGDVEAMTGIAGGELVRFLQGENIEIFGDAADPDDDPVLASGFPVHRSVDARLILDDGREPLPEVLDAAGELTPGMVLDVVAPFHPLPLRRLLGQRRFSSSAWPENECWRVVFMKRKAA